MDGEARVLLVDDEEEFLTIMAERLETRGFTVFKALNAEEALNLVQAEEIDVIVLDVLMPGKDGINTLRELKPLKPLVAVIMLTGHATVETAIEGMKLGAYDYLIKPAEINELVEKIRKAQRLKLDQEERIRQAEINKILKKRGW